ncbi:four helix bundle protein [Perlabentimonas gracilis]|uniref:four helix bundle protein n=1 Tax=Perlabentimonas gracilis TaxID=2715279 RepID=UPI00140C71B3|nr:four helix bundle protein [Perlabentimonas gracilis]NHB69180.1 four helix bundle protein [Perlabentimonas gracilis]
MKIERFEEIIAWQKAQDVAVDIYFSFSNAKDYSFKDQICRASVSISNNIAEGFDRGTDADFTRFLYIATASCSEVRSMLYLAERLKYIEIQKRDDLINNCLEISRLIKGFIKSLNNKSHKP